MESSLDELLLSALLSRLRLRLADRLVDRLEVAPSFLSDRLRLEDRSLVFDESCCSDERGRLRLVDRSRMLPCRLDDVPVLLLLLSSTATLRAPDLCKLGLRLSTFPSFASKEFNKFPALPPITSSFPDELLSLMAIVEEDRRLVRRDDLLLDAVSSSFSSSLSWLVVDRRLLIRREEEEEVVVDFDEAISDGCSLVVERDSTVAVAVAVGTVVVSSDCRSSSDSAAAAAATATRLSGDEASIGVVLLLVAVVVVVVFSNMDATAVMDDDRRLVPRILFEGDRRIEDASDGSLPVVGVVVEVGVEAMAMAAISGDDDAIPKLDRRFIVLRLGACCGSIRGITSSI